MINNYYLPGLDGDNQYRHYGAEINELDTPMIYLFITDIELFYKKNCKSLDAFKLREKRLLDFETPNRALITHEYDMEVNDSFDYSKYCYLFNPTKRLSWLKISQDGKRLPIAKENDIKDYVREILKNELNKISVTFDELWRNKRGIPCFIKLHKSSSVNFLLTASYYDSIKVIGSENRNFFSPLMERRIRYDYLPLEGKSSWLYVKAPKNFNVRYNSKLIESLDHNIIDFANSDGYEADPEKVSLTIIDMGNSKATRNAVSLSLDIYVPDSLKIWFLCIYYISVIVIAVLLSVMLNEFYLLLWKPILNSECLLSILFLNTNFGGIIMGLIAAIITTRSWLITEETIMKYYSIYLTRMMAFMIFSYITIMILGKL